MGDKSGYWKCFYSLPSNAVKIAGSVSCEWWALTTLQYFIHLSDIMNKDNILGIPIYRFYYSSEKVDQVKKEVLNLKWVRNPQNWMWSEVDEGKNLHELPEFKELFDWFQECLNEVRLDLSLTCDSLKVVSSWANLNKKGQSFHDHIHPNAFMSSNYYVSGGEGTHTVWHMENPYFKNNIYPLEGDSNIYHYEPTEPGKFIVFPPNIYHYSTPNRSDDDRITIAANIFPEGTISYGSVSKMKISIH
jgi:uncharacterized protein (TIGR02466 family)